MPALPVMDSYVAVRTEINGNGDFDYESDIRSLEESNGVWNIKLISEGISGPYTFSMKSNNDLPTGLDFALLTFQTKMLYVMFYLNRLPYKKVYRMVMI